MLRRRRSTHPTSGARINEIVTSDSWSGPVARTPAGNTVHVRITIEHRERLDGGFYETTDHGAIPTYDAVLVVWTLYDERDCVVFRGQPGEEVAKAIPIIPALDYAALLVMWRRWHCQALRPGCVHQSPGTSDEVRTQLRATRRCPIDDYVFGSEMLVQTLPGDVITRVRQIGAQLIREAVSA